MHSLFTSVWVHPCLITAKSDHLNTKWRKWRTITNSFYRLHSPGTHAVTKTNCTYTYWGFTLLPRTGVYTATWEWGLHGYLRRVYTATGDWSLHCHWGLGFTLLPEIGVYTATGDWGLHCHWGLGFTLLPGTRVYTGTGVYTAT